MNHNMDGSVQLCIMFNKFTNVGVQVHLYAYSTNLTGLEVNDNINFQ